MHIEEFRHHCLSLPGTTEGFPFDEDTLVFKVLGKMFALASLEHNPLRVNLKCEPEQALRLREKYPAVQPGYHMNKKLWNTVTFDGSISDEEILAWLNHSYQQVVITLPKKLQSTLPQS